VRSRSGSLDAPFPLQERLRGVSRDVILRVAIGVVDSSRDRVAEIEEMPNEEIGARRYDPSRAERDNVLSMLVLSQPHELGLLSDREIRDELLILLIAGHETTATVLAWTLERLLRHPEALSRTLEELDDGDGETYLDPVIRESLRPEVQPIPSACGSERTAAPAEVDSVTFYLSRW
jgi:cytochrome P450